MSFPDVLIGGRPFNHDRSDAAEIHFDKLRDSARAEYEAADRLFKRAAELRDQGDGYGASEAVRQAHERQALGRKFNEDASDYILAENNADGRVESDALDLHGKFVSEGRKIAKERIQKAQSEGQSHLHIIVGKGNHSPGHVQHLKPAIEEVCRDLGLQYHTEHNEGRIYVNLTGGAAEPNSHGGGYGGPQQHHKPQHGGQQYHPPQHGGQQHHQQQHGGQHHQQQHGGQYHGGQQHGKPDENMQLEQEVKKALPKIFKILKGCCTVM